MNSSNNSFGIEQQQRFPDRTAGFSQNSRLPGIFDFENLFFNQFICSCVLVEKDYKKSILHFSTMINDSVLNVTYSFLISIDVVVRSNTFINTLELEGIIAY